jgi:hypothetical protein
MKAKIFSLFLLVFSVISLNAALPPMKVATTDATIQLSSEDLMALTPAKYQELTGEKLGLKGKLALYLLKKEVKKKGTTETIQLEEELANNDGGFNLIGFLAGFLLSIIGVLLVFLLASNNKAMKRSAWLGFGIMVLLALLGIVL